MSGEHIPAGCHFTENHLPQTNLAVSPSRVHGILDQIGIPLDDWDTITLPPNVMEQL